MEAIFANSTALELFIDGTEYIVLMRPTGMVATVVLANPALGASIGLVKLLDGAILRINPEAVVPLVSGRPSHACDDRLRFLVARWYRAFVELQSRRAA